MTKCITFSAVCSLFMCISLAEASESAPNHRTLLGHADFYPSAERPIGWRGDGSGAWPGATPVRSWNAQDGTNIVWKTPMPGPSFSQPVVVGDKVFTLADPNWLICVSAVDGKVIWQKQVDHTVSMPPDVAARAREARAFWADQFMQYAIWSDVQRGHHPQLPQEQIDKALKAADEHGFTANAPGQANFDMIRHSDSLWSRCLKDQADYSLYSFGHWEGLVTQTIATPVSDGQSIFVSMANDQIACYDLDGGCRWLIWDRPRQAPPAEMHVRYAMSPRLVGDKLIVAACGELRAYDKGTGKKLWGVYSREDFGGYWVKVGTPVTMQVPLDGKPLDILLSPGSGIYRLSDGKLIGSLPPLIGYEGATALTDGRVYVRKDAPDGGASTRVAGTLKVRSADQVEFEELWRASYPRGKAADNATDVMFDGWIYAPQHSRRIEVSSGKFKDLPHAPTQWCSPALGGRLLVMLDGGGYDYRPTKKGGQKPGVMSAAVIDLENGAASPVSFENAFVDHRYDEDQDFRLRFRWRGNGDAMSHSSPSFQGNRMFFRTVGFLWCVGDPKQAWQTPQNAPPVARVAK